MARAVGDGTLNIYIQDVVVHDNWQGRGVGRHIIMQLLSDMSAVYPQNCTIGLMAAKGQEGFYKKLGFATRPVADLGAGMTASLHTLAKTLRPKYEDAQRT